MPLPIVTALQAALDAGDDAAVKNALQTMHEAGQLAPYLKGRIVFPNERTMWDMLRIMAILEQPDYRVAGGSLLANTAYHGAFDLGDRGEQRLGYESLLEMGANPNLRYQPAEAAEGSVPLSIYSMLILAEIGRPVLNQPPLVRLLEMLLDTDMHLQDALDEPSRLHEMVMALNPANLLNKMKNKPSDGVEFEPGRRRHPPFDTPQLEQTRQLLSALGQAGADFRAPFPQGTPSQFGCAADTLKGKTPVQVLDMYIAWLNEGIAHPDMLQKRCREAGGPDAAYMEYRTDPEVLRDAKDFYHHIRNHIRDIAIGRSADSMLLSR